MKRVIALGFFDGVHLGHGALLRRTVELARAQGAVAAACTFEPHPAALLTGRAVPLLTTAAERSALMREGCGIDEVIVLPFDEAMMAMPWDRFVTDCLIGELGACHLVCGADHRFGWRGEGDAGKLRGLCAALGVGCDIIAPVTVQGEAVSSSRIRALIEAGELERAAALLGRAVPPEWLERT